MEGDYTHAHTHICASICSVIEKGKSYMNDLKSSLINIKNSTNSTKCVWNKNYMSSITMYKIYNVIINHSLLLIDLFYHTKYYIYSIKILAPTSSLSRNSYLSECFYIKLF